MAWDISISAEGWADIRGKLNEWSRKALIAAIVDDTFDSVYEKSGMDNAERAADAEQRRIRDLPQDALADVAFELIRKNNTCGNGGFAYWINQDGYHKVFLDE